jgi:ankyrin repeat protein
MLVESLLDEDDLKEEKEREDEIWDEEKMWGESEEENKKKRLMISYQDYQQYCHHYSQNNGRRNFRSQQGTEVEGEVNDLEYLEDILKYLSSNSSRNQNSNESLFDSYFISSSSHQGNLLHLSILFNDLKLMQLLLKYHFNPFYPDHKHGNTPLHYAAINGNPELLKSLLRILRTDPPHHPPQSSPPHSPSSYVSQDQINLQNLSGKTCLHYCCEYGYDECVKILLQSAPPSSTSPCSSPHSTLQHHHWEQHLNLNLCDHNGNTPLHLACIDGSLLCVQSLLISGCDVTIRNNDQKTALEIVMSMSMRDGIKKELESHSTPSKRTVNATSTANGGLFDGMEMKESHSGPSSPPPPAGTASDLFAGLFVTSSPTRELSESSPRHLTTTYMHNKAENPAAIPATHLVPTGRWVVIQSNKLVIDRSSRKLIIHRNK